MASAVISSRVVNIADLPELARRRLPRVVFDYRCGGGDLAMAPIARAQAAGYSALVVTIDTPVAGLRERDLRNGTREILTRDPWAMAPFVGQFLARPRWLKDFLADGGLMNFPNI